MSCDAKYVFSIVNGVEDLKWLNEPKTTKLGGGDGQLGLEVYMVSS